MEERRKYARHRIYSPAEAKTALRTIPVVIREISVGGLKVHSASALTPKTRINVIINIGRELAINGHTVWVLEKVSKGNRFYQSGLDAVYIRDQEEDIYNIKQREKLIQEIVNLTQKKHKR